jgi:hypothetical protein
VPSRRCCSTVINTDDVTGPERGSRGHGQSVPRPEPRIGRKDLQDPDRDVTESGHLVPEDEHGQSGRDAGVEGPEQLEIPAAEQYSPVPPPCGEGHPS